MRAITIIGFACLAIASCAAPEDQNQGYCRLSCANTTLAAADFKIGSKSAGSVTYQCTGNEALRMQASWLITADSKIVDGSSVNVERSGIGFHLFVGNNSNYSIVTPESEWCSDACGLASVTVDGKCNVDADSEYTLELQSGAARSDQVKFTLSKPQ